MSAATAFAPLRLALDDAAVRFAVGGSWASTAFGEPRLTKDVGIPADFTHISLHLFLSKLPPANDADPDDALAALRLGRRFRAIHMPEVFKFDLFPASVSLLAKLPWFRTGGEISEVQWRDILGVARACASRLDYACLDAGAAKLGIATLLSKALAETTR